MARLSELIREGITATTLGPCVKKALSFSLGADSTASPMWLWCRPCSCRSPRASCAWKVIEPYFRAMAAVGRKVGRGQIWRQAYAPKNEHRISGVRNSSGSSGPSTYSGHSSAVRLAAPSLQCERLTVHPATSRQRCTISMICLLVSTAGIVSRTWLSRPLRQTCAICPWTAPP
jgi:hypothetical protein